MEDMHGRLTNNCAKCKAWSCFLLLQLVLNALLPIFLRVLSNDMYWTSNPLGLRVTFPLLLDIEVWSIRLIIQSRLSWFYCKSDLLSVYVIGSATIRLRSAYILLNDIRIILLAMPRIKYPLVYPPFIKYSLHQADFFASLWNLCFLFNGKFILSLNIIYQLLIRMAIISVEKG